MERKKLADKEIDVYTRLETLDASRIVEIVARVYKVDRERLIKPQARKYPNWERKIAMYAYQRYGMIQLSEIA